MSTRPQSPLERRHLEAVVAVADFQSVHSAARALGVPQPVLSRRIADAERILGTRLFERSSTGSRPTPVGASVVRQGKFTLRAFQEVSEVLGADPMVRFGCVARAFHLLMPRILEGLIESREKVRLHVTEGLSSGLVADLLDARLDFVISRRMPSLDTERFVCEVLYSERTVVVCGRSNSSVPAKPARLRELSEMPWILPASGSDARELIDRAFIDSQLPRPEPLIEARSFDSLLAVVASTRLISIAPESVARRYEKMGLVRIVRLVRPLKKSEVMLVYPSLVRNQKPFAAIHRLVLAGAADARRSLRH